MISVNTAMSMTNLSQILTSTNQGKTPNTNKDKVQPIRNTMPADQLINHP